MVFEEFNESEQVLVEVTRELADNTEQYSQTVSGIHTVMLSDELEWVLMTPLVLVLSIFVIYSISSSLSKAQLSLLHSLLYSVPSTEPSSCQSILQKDLLVPHHIAVIMDGNRRYGRKKYGNATRGHSDGSETLVKFVSWCQNVGIEIVTVYAFSTENWNREQREIDALMDIFLQFMDRIAEEALEKNIQIRVLTSDGRKLPPHIVQAIAEIELRTKECSGMILCVCISYGAQGEITRACKSIAQDVHSGDLALDAIDEALVASRLLSSGLRDPDLLLRTSGEQRLSNFLLYQLAYSELIFVDKAWPEMTEQDLHQVIYEFNRRKRRFGR